VKNIEERWQEVQSRVGKASARAGRKLSDVRIVAVSKTFSVDRVVEAHQAGARMFGENYVQEALPKIEAFQRKVPSESVEWHFIGALQSNKAKKVAGIFSLIHSVDRRSLAEALEKARKSVQKPVSVLIEVNVAGEESKSGISPDQLRSLLEQIAEKTGIEVKGLMTFPPLVENPELSRPYFGRLRELAEEVRGWNLPRVSMSELSMGVTSDYEVAVEEGATLVRVGTAIFGPREPKT